MNKVKEKIGSNIHQNFNVSPEIQAWSKKYNISVAKIQQLFEASGNSIAKTLAALREKAANL